MPTVSGSDNNVKELEADMNDRRKKTEQLSIVMRQFLKFRFDSSMRYNMKIVPPNFD